MTDLQNKVITIANVEKKLTSQQQIFYKIGDQDNKHYNLFKFKQDGSESSAYQFFKTLPDDGLGQTVEIAYAEQSYMANGKTNTSKNIRAMKVASQQAYASPQMKSVPPAQLKSKLPLTGNETDWDKIRGEKRDDIKWMNALNNASLLVSYGKADMANLEALANRIYLLEPKKVEKVIPEFSEPTIEYPMPDDVPMPEDEIKVDDVLF